MTKPINVVSLLKELKTNEFILNAKMPLGYVHGIPILQFKNDNLCIAVPYLKYKTTGKVDQTLVYPIRNVITLLIPEKTVIKFEDLRYEKKYSKLDFTKPVGLFRHESIKTLTKQEYGTLRHEMYGLYDKLISSLINDTEYTEEDDARLGALIKKLLEPSLKPMYKAIDPDFYSRYIAE